MGKFDELNLVTFLKIGQFGPYFSVKFGQILTEHELTERRQFLTLCIRWGASTKYFYLS